VKADNNANLYKMVHKAVEKISERLYDLQDNSRNSVLNSEEAFKTAEDVRTVLMAMLQVIYLIDSDQRSLLKSASTDVIISNHSTI